MTFILQLLDRKVGYERRGRHVAKVVGPGLEPATARWGLSLRWRRGCILPLCSCHAQSHSSFEVMFDFIFITTWLCYKMPLCAWKIHYTPIKKKRKKLRDSFHYHNSNEMSGSYEHPRRMVEQFPYLAQESDFWTHLLWPSSTFYFKHRE